MMFYVNILRYIAVWCMLCLCCFRLASSKCRSYR